MVNGTTILQQHVYRATQRQRRRRRPSPTTTTIKVTGNFLFKFACIELMSPPLHLGSFHSHDQLQRQQLQQQQRQFTSTNRCKCHESLQHQ
ncbi:hypothetical protein RDWZM_001596 [Blomia tropicalis]|uniref:Uncharacterized protein n=1 Tax=Blomia tropicalis TaxID=40697 RepID=A0A9Q0MC02_BLOTA|nr:hypothetical protein RDWZM_001596 [Blomia tropicalis]